jgi:hypothetical protein
MQAGSSTTLVCTWRTLRPAHGSTRAHSRPLGLGITGEEEGWFSADELFVSGDGPVTSGLHVAFQAQDRETVDRLYAAAIEAGGRDNGAPGERSYHPGYYAAYVLEPGWYECRGRVPRSGEALDAVCCF